MTLCRRLIYLPPSVLASCQLPELRDHRLGLDQLAGVEPASLAEGAGSLPARVLEWAGFVCPDLAMILAVNRL